MPIRAHGRFSLVPMAPCRHTGSSAAKLVSVHFLGKDELTPIFCADIGHRFSGDVAHPITLADSASWELKKYTKNVDGKEITRFALTLKQGATPADAVREFFKKGLLGQLDCASATSVIRLAALLESVKDDTFNKMMPKDLTIFGHLIGRRETIERGLLDTTIFEGFTKAGSPMPGDIVIWDNPTAKRGKNDPYRYENSIYLGKIDGKNMYFAHPFGIVDEDTLLRKIQDESGATERAKPGNGLFFKNIPR